MTGKVPHVHNDHNCEIHVYHICFVFCHFLSSLFLPYHGFSNSIDFYSLYHLDHFMAISSIPYSL